MSWNQPSYYQRSGDTQSSPSRYQPTQSSVHNRQQPSAVQQGGPNYGSSYGQPSSSQYGQHQYGQHQYGQPPSSQYGQHQYGQPPSSQYGQPPSSQYGQPPSSQYGQPPSSQYGQPPSSQYGQPPSSQYGQPPSSQYGQPPVGSRGPVPVKPEGVSDNIWVWFQSVDKDSSGSINVEELREALLNNNWTHFNEETCRLLIGMFDRNKDGTIDVYEFEALWKYVQEWRKCFEKYDRDKTGKMNTMELHKALTDFGYALTPEFCNLCTRVFDRKDTRSMKFDDFIQCCVMINILTDSFKKRDTQRSGVITVHYEDFLEMVLDNQIV